MKIFKKIFPSVFIFLIFGLVNLFSNFQNVVNADTISLPMSYDAYVWAGGPSENFGGESQLMIGSEPEGTQYQSFLKPNLSSLPSISGNDCTVNSATLYLYCFSQNGSSYDIWTGVYRVTGSWSEGGITWNTKPGRTSQ